MVKEYAEILGERARAFWDKVIRAGDRAMQEIEYRRNREARRDLKNEAEERARDEDPNHKPKKIKPYRSGVTVEDEGSGEKRYEIASSILDTEGREHKNVVLLDTDFFDGISPRNWGKALERYLKERIGKSTFIMPVQDEYGNTQNLEFARWEDRTRKGEKSDHKVVRELTRTTDNISKLSVIQINEIVQVSEEKSPYYTSDNEHGWLDKYGWLHRTAEVVNVRNGNIYRITMDIAKAEDGRFILYALNGDTKRIGNAEMSSITEMVKGSPQNTYSVGNPITSSDKSQEFFENFSKKRLSISDAELAKMDQDYMEAGEAYESDPSEANEARLRKMVEAAAKDAVPVRMTLSFGGTQIIVFSLKNRTP